MSINEEDAELSSNIKNHRLAELIISSGFPSGLFLCCSPFRLKNKICAYANVCQFSSRHNPTPSPDAPLSSCHSLHHVWEVLSSLTELTQQLRWKFRTFYLRKTLSLARYAPKYGNVAALH